jgi:hypothetical protein
MSDDNVSHQGQAPIHHDPLVECPTCGLPAAITDRFVLDGAPAPVEHVKLVCVRRHWYTAAGRPPNWQLIAYGGAVHGLTHDIGPALPGVAYNSVADSGSFAAIQAFLKDTFEGSSTSEQPVRSIPAAPHAGRDPRAAPKSESPAAARDHRRNSGLFPQKTTSATASLT